MKSIVRLRNTALICAIAAALPAHGSDPGTRYGYDPNGNPTSVLDPLDHATSSQYDSLNRILQITNPANGVISYQYDGADRIQQITDPRGLSTHYQYNGLGDLVRQDSPDTGATVFTYDEAGNVLSRTDAKQQTTTYQYDAMNRRIKETRADGSTVNYLYDGGANGKGRLTGITDSSGSTNWVYDGLGWVIQKQQIIGAYTHTTQYAYNAQGQRVSMTYPSGKVIGYVYNGNGQVIAITVNGSPLISHITYQPFGPPQSWSFGNGQTISRTFDLKGQVTGNSLGSLGYDDASRITNAYGNSYGYDALDRLTTFTDGVTPLTYSYDANGNRVVQTVGTTTNSYAIDAASNRIQSISAGATTLNYGYDANGSIINDGKRGYQYDAAGRLTQNIYAYNGMGQRVRKNRPMGAPIRFVYDEAGQLIGEYGDISAAVAQPETIYLGNTPVAVLKNSSIYYIHTDHLNTPRKIYNANGQLVWKWDIATFGSTLSNENPSQLGLFTYNLRFPGQYFDKETGLSYNYSRDYDSATGRYLQSDPIGLKGGVNTYLYAMSDPISLIDPSGLYVPNLPWTPEDTKKRNCFIRKYRKSSLGAWGASRVDRNAHPEDLNRRNAEHYLYAEELRNEYGKTVAVAGVVAHEATKVARLPDSVPLPTTPPTKDGEKAGMEGALGIPIPEDGDDDNCECAKK